MFACFYDSWYDFIMENKSLDFRQHFIAQFTLPKNAQNDFTVWTNIPWSDVGVMICIPGQDTYLKFNIHTQNALRKFIPDRHNYSCLFSLESAASSIPTVASYHKSDENYYQLIVNNNDTFCIDSSLCSATEFLDIIEKKLNSLLYSRFDNNFKVYDRNSGHLNTTLSPDYVEKSIATFKRAFNKCRRILDPKVNNRYQDLISKPNGISMVNSIVNEHNLRKLNLDLQKTLPSSNLKGKTVKI